MDTSGSMSAWRVPWARYFSTLNSSSKSSLVHSATQRRHQPSKVRWVRRRSPDSGSKSTMGQVSCTGAALRSKQRKLPALVRWKGSGSSTSRKSCSKNWAI
jgi:hypothetical protein